MSEIHDKYDQIIYLEAGISSTFAVGLLSTMFIPPLTERMVWLGMWLTGSISLVATCAIYASAVACFFHFKYVEMSRFDIGQEAQERCDQLATWWRPIRNMHSYFFWAAIAFGMLCFALRITHFINTTAFK